ncbi:MAG: riboflavin kinase [Candidatus Riflebacteria bacterium]
MYHRTIRIRFVKRIREEKKFPDMESLRQQIRLDQAAAEMILAQPI